MCDGGRPKKKYVHACFQAVATVLIVFGLVAVFRSHTQKKPTPYHDLYSVHSYVAITALAIFALQVRLAAQDWEAGGEFLGGVWEHGVHHAVVS